MPTKTELRSVIEMIFAQFLLQAHGSVRERPIKEPVKKALVEDHQGDHQEAQTSH